jgi:hypothetical protein
MRSSDEVYNHYRAEPGSATMAPSSSTRRSKRTAARIFVLLFVAMMVGFYFTIGADAVGLGGVWSIFVILAVLLVIVALFFLR